MKLFFSFFCYLSIVVNYANSDSHKIINIEPDSDIKITGDIIEYDPNKNISTVHSGSQKAKIAWSSKTHQNMIFAHSINVSHKKSDTDPTKKVSQVHTITLEGPVLVTLDPFSKSDKIISIHAKQCIYKEDQIDCHGDVDISIDQNKIHGDQVHFNFNTLLFEVKSKHSCFAEAHFVIPQKAS